MYDAISGTDPETSPAIYGELTREFRTRTSAALPAGAELPELIITEWNLSGGGFDLRHGTHEGAAFVLGSLIEMERAGLDRAMMFRAVDGEPVAVSLGLEGGCAPTPGCMGFLDAESDTLDASRPIRAEDGRYRFVLPAQSSARLRLTCPD